MSIKAIHIILISCAVLLSLGFALWCFAYANSAGDAAYRNAGTLSFLVAIALGFYGVRFIKKAKSLL